MHFVLGHGQVADCVEDGPTSLALYNKVSFYCEEIERVGQIIKFDPYLEDAYHVSCFTLGKGFEYFRVIWNPLFQKFEAIKRI